MSISGNTEPGAVSGQLGLQQRSSINFSSAIPIKKRRVPVIQLRSPSPEKEALNSDGNDSTNKPELGDEKNMASPRNSAVSKTTAFIVKKEEVTPTNIELGQTNVDILPSKPLEEKPVVSLGSIGDLRNKGDVILNEEHKELGIPESSMSAQTATVRDEIVCAQVLDAPRLELSMSSMNVELSLGPKEPPFPARSEKSDPTLLSLASSKENLSLHSKNGNTADNVRNEVGANRSNWDLNTTMDVWEGSTVGNAIGHRPVESSAFSKANRSSDATSALVTAGTIGLPLNKGKHVLNYHKSNSSNASDDSLGLKLATPSRELNANIEHPDSNKLASLRASPQVSMQQVRLTAAMNLNKAVKLEPVDESSKQDYSAGSCGNNTVGLSNISSVKKELVNNAILETALAPSTSPGKLVDSRSIQSGKVEGNQEALKCKDTIPLQSVARVIQHQDSCASSSALPATAVPENSCHSTLPSCLDLTKNGESSNQSEHSFSCKESHDDTDKPDEQIAGMGDIGNSNVEASVKCESARVGEHTLESCKSVDVTGEHTLESFKSVDVTANDEEKISMTPEVLEDAFGSDSESQEMDIDEENVNNKEYEGYEDGEVREPSQHSTGENLVVDHEKTARLELVERNSGNSQDPIPMDIGNIDVPNFVEKVDTKKTHDNTSGDMIKDHVSISYKPNSEDSTSQRLPDKVTELGVDFKSITVASDKRLNSLGKKVVDRSPGKEGNMANKDSHGMKVALGSETTNKVVKEICSGEDDSTLSKEEAPLHDHDAIKDSNNIRNKSRIINLSRTSVVTTPSKTRPIPNRLPTSRNGKERYSDIDGNIQPRVNRDDFYIGGSKKFVKDRVHDRSVRNSFMRGKGRMSGRFGLRREWDTDHDFVSENYRGQSDYPAIRRSKHGSSISNVDLDCNGYGIPEDGTALSSGRRKEINDEFPSLRHASLRRMSPGDRDGTDARGIQMLRRIPRNMGVDEDCSDMISIRHGNKFMRHLSDDIIDPVYSRQQAVYDELDGQLLRENRNYSTMHRNAYPRIGSKSPVRSRTRSPGPWLSPRRRSPNGPPNTMYRMGRMRSPERACFRDEMINRRRGSPSYFTRHPNEPRDVDSGRDHAHHRPNNSHRRSSPARAFPRNARRADALDSQEMGEGSNEYITGLLHPNKFHSDGSSDERRNFIERRGLPIRSFRPMYGGDSDDFQFHQNNDCPRMYRFCPEVENEFAERNSNFRGREFDGRIKHQQHQPMPMSRRIRNIEEQPMERAWHDDGYADTRMKRMRF